MSIYKSPFIEPYTGRLSRHSCPRCKQNQSFSLYIDGSTNKPIHRSVGRCNRENSCAYHYTPREYFRDNPDNGLAYKLKNNPLQGKYKTEDKSSVLNPNFNIDKDVMLYPDAGYMEKWTKKMNEIRRKVPSKMSVSDLIEKHATTKQLEYGYDLADFIIDNTKTDTLKEMVEINPALQDLIDELGLEVCE